jgi:hypothetical protein
MIAWLSRRLLYLRHLPLRNEPVGDAALVEDLDGA